MNIRQAKIRGEVIVAKPVLLLALIDGISENVFTDNAFELNDWLEDRYVTLMRNYMQNSQFTKVTGIENPGATDKPCGVCTVANPKTCC